MRDKFAEALFEIATKDNSVIIVAADISPVGKINDFVIQNPDRFLNVGVAEQSMIGISAGLAMAGFRPFCYTIANFSVIRPFEFLRIDLGYQNLPVTVVGMGAGISYSTLGFTHHAQEDIALCLTVPNMQIYTPFDPNSTKLAVNQIMKFEQSPVYLRLGKNGEPNLDVVEYLTDSLDPNFVIGSLLIPAQKHTQIVIFTYGPIAFEVQQAASLLMESGFTVQVVSMLKLTGINWREILEKVSASELVVFVEEHIEIGGIASLILHNNLNSLSSVPLLHLYLPKIPTHLYGERTWLLDKLGLSSKKIVQRVLSHLRLNSPNKYQNHHL